MNIIFDIETCGVDVDELSESQQEFIFRYAEREPLEEVKELKKNDAVRYLSLYPLTAKVVAISLMNEDTGNTMTLFEGEEGAGWESEEGNLIYRGENEEGMIRKFWEYTAKAEKVITFNGRWFDIPFLMMRSAILRIKPTRNFMKRRFDKADHIDLLEQFTYNGLTKKFNLDFYCRAFGVESPKSRGVTGMEVKELYNAGRIKELAVYCADDVKATYELYKIWKDYLDI